MALNHRNRQHWKNPRTPHTVHGNSLEYVGETHVYKIVDQFTGRPYKAGESTQGLNRFGKSKRAEAQKVKLEDATGQKFETDVTRTFDNKRSAKQHETTTIERGREMHGAGTFPGNKGVH